MSTMCLSACWKKHDESIQQWVFRQRVVNRFILFPNDRNSVSWFYRSIGINIQFLTFVVDMTDVDFIIFCTSLRLILLLVYCFVHPVLIRDYLDLNLMYNQLNSTPVFAHGDTWQNACMFQKHVVWWCFMHDCKLYETGDTLHGFLSVTIQLFSLNKSGVI